MDISKSLQKILPKGFLFNPCIAPITEDIWLLSVRYYLDKPDKPMDDNPVLISNKQHPWGTDWAGKDITYILPVKYTGDGIECVKNQHYPFSAPVQDMRIMRFMEDDEHIAYILTFNETYDNNPDMVIKNGDRCDESCYIIGWAYLLVDKATLRPSYVPAEKPLCLNISNPVEKNWSLWRYDNGGINIMISYALTPEHSVFSYRLKGVKDDYMVGGSKCDIQTARQKPETSNVLGDLETYYDNKLFVSLSTPSVPVNDKDVYQAVGHIKVKIDYLRKLNDGSPLAKFADKHIKRRHKDYLNPTYVYFMFIYRFQVIKAPEDIEVLVDPDKSGYIELEGSKDRLYAIITFISPAFIHNPTKHKYYLNFPCGMIIHENETIISYGNADATANLIKFSDDEVENMLEPVTDVRASNYKFITL